MLFEFSTFPLTEKIDYNPVSIGDQPNRKMGHVLGVKMEKHKDHKEHGKVETVKKFYNFTLLPPGRVDPIHLYGFFRLNAEDNFTTTPLFDFLIGENPLVKFFPVKYQIQLITIDGSDQPFTLIEGERCKWRCDRRTRECHESVCWETPSFCRGNHEDCLKLDGEGTCFDIQQNGYPEAADHVWMSNSTHKVFTNIDIGKYARYHGQDNLFISNDGRAQDLITIGYSWVCKEVVPGGEHIFCDVDFAHLGVSTYLLKTLAG